MTKKVGLLVILSLILVIMAFGDNIYLKDGTKLVGKIVSFGETLVDILLESGRLVTVNKNEIIRIETLDSPQMQGAPQAGAMPPGGGMPPGGAIPPDGGMPMPGAAIGSAGVGVPAVSFGPEVPVFLGDPELELRKRMLMYHDMRKEAWIATQMSLFIPSAGHLYTGEWERGFLFLGARAVLGGVTIWGLLPVDRENPDTGDIETVPQNLTVGAIAGAGFALFTLLEAVDAYYSAERHNQLLRIRLGIEQFDPMMIHTFGR